MNLFFLGVLNFLIEIIQSKQESDPRMTPNPIKNQFILTPSFLDEPLLELKSLAQPGWIINEFSLPNGSRQTRIAAINKRLSQIVVESILAGRRPVSIAGDCLSAIGVLTGLQR
ncbi:MAG: hypothetical protein MUP19_07455, partial [Candidatus Aminicenantes bacterium]|nr:hypothetical protein [Candidatus Aminicenantes bacterium]